MTDYSQNLGLRKPAAQMWNWHHDWKHNQDITDVMLNALCSKNRVMSGGEVTLSGGLGYHVAACEVFLAGNYVSVAEAWDMVSVPDGSGDGDPDKINWIFVDSSGVVADSADYPTDPDHVILARIDTTEAGIFLLVDLRVMGYGDPEKPQQSGVDFVDADLSAGVLTHTHNLDVLHLAAVTIWDDNKCIIQPDKVSSVDADSIAVDLSSFAPISGTWHLSIRS